MEHKAKYVQWQRLRHQQMERLVGHTELLGFMCKACRQQWR